MSRVVVKEGGISNLRVLQWSIRLTEEEEEEEEEAVIRQHEQAGK